MTSKHTLRLSSGAFRGAWLVALVAVSSTGQAGCSEAAGETTTARGDEAVSGAANGADGTVGGAAGGAPADPSTPQAGTAAGTPSNMAGAAAAGAPGDGTTLDVPEDEVALRAFLDAGSYREWAKEGDFHPSAGPHGASVRTYYSPKAAAALNAGAAEFPAGAAAIKEAASDAGVYGHSVWIKVQPTSDTGQGFFWYEVFVREDGSETIYGNARGSSQCVGCHSLGHDYNRSTLPFE